MKRKADFCGTAILVLSFVFAAMANAQTTGTDFQQAVTAYQQSQNAETATSVIKMAAAMRQLPPIPEEAREHFVRGTALFKDVKSPDDYAQVIEEFKEAVRLAPWWPQARYNWALTYGASGIYGPAIDNLRLYLLFKLPEADARVAQDKIYELQARQEKAVKAKAEADAAAAAAAEQQRAQEQAQEKEKLLDDVINRLQGKVFSCSPECLNGDTYRTVHFSGRTVLLADIMPTSEYGIRAGYHETYRFGIENHEELPDGTIVLNLKCLVMTDLLDHAHEDCQGDLNKDSVVIGSDPDSLIMRFPIQGGNGSLYTPVFRLIR